MTEPLDAISATPIDTLEAILTQRFSCRGFTDRPIGGDTLRRLFTVAQRTASWCNSQAWQVHLLSGDDTAALGKRLIDHVATSSEAPDIPGPERYDGVYQDRRRACGFALYNAVGLERDDKEGRVRQMLQNFRFFGAPHTAIVTSPTTLGTYGVMDCGGYVANLLNAAEALGVNAIAQAAPAMYADAVHDLLGIPEDRNVVCAVSLGYADPHHPANGFRTEREDVDVAVAGLL